MTYLRTALAVASVLGLVWLGLRIESSGYDRAVADMARERMAREKQIAAGFVQAVADAERRRAKALADLNELRSRPPVVITDVQTEIIERNVCRRFDRDFIGLLDDT